MAKIPVKKFVQNIITIYNKKPKYVLGADSFTECDCIGMPRRAHKMEGITPSGMSGTNYFARYTAKNLKKITSVSQLKVGDAVLKTAAIDHPSWPLPAKYRKGGSSYNGDLNNYSHIGTVTGTNPLEITHMTSPTAKKDSKLGNWTYFGQYPLVDYNNSSSDDKVVITMETATVVGGSLNMRKDTDTNSTRITIIPSGSKVAVIEKGSVWCKAVYNEYTGYVMTKYLSFESDSTDNSKITISLQRDVAKALYEALKVSLNL